MRISKIVPATAGLKRHSLAPAHVVSPLKIAALAAVCMLASAAVTAAVNTPYQSLVDMTGKCPKEYTAPTCAFIFPAVPNGYRLVVEHISGFAEFDGITNLVVISATLLNGGGNLWTNFSAPTFNLQPYGFGVATTFDHAVLLYVDAGQSLQVQVGPIAASFSQTPISLSMSPAT